MQFGSRVPSTYELHQLFVQGRGAQVTDVVLTFYARSSMVMPD
ncbi:VanZ family protein [Bacillus litorisediminis]